MTQKPTETKIKSSQPPQRTNTAIINHIQTNQKNHQTASSNQSDRGYRNFINKKINCLPY